MIVYAVILVAVTACILYVKMGLLVLISPHPPLLSNINVTKLPTEGVPVDGEQTS